MKSRLRMTIPEGSECDILVAQTRPSEQNLPISDIAHSFDHLVGAGEQRCRHRKAERPGGLEVHAKLELGR